MTTTRTPAKKKARELVKYLRKEHPDYAYLKEVFRQLQVELEITIAGPVVGCRMCRRTKKSVATTR